MANDTSGRPAKLPTGLSGGGLPAQVTEIERRLGADEPPPWPVNAELSVVGKPTPRLDGRLKVTGAARYTADVRLPGMLYARTVVSVHPHARIVSIDTSEAERHPLVRAVHVLDHLMGAAQLRDKSQELPSKF